MSGQNFPVSVNSWGQLETLVPNTEIAAQSLNALSWQTTKIVLNPQETVYDWDAICSYRVSNYQSATFNEVIPNRVKREHGFQIRRFLDDNITVYQPCDPDSCFLAAVRLCKYKVEFYVKQVNGTYPGSPNNYFYLDTRDCSWLISDCYNYGSCNVNDITIRYDVQNNQIWLYGTNVTKEIDESWKLVSTAETVYWADIKNGCQKRCWLIGNPSTPTNFHISGSRGQNPTLHWDINVEPDLAGYKIYSSYDGSPFALLMTLNDPNQNSFTDRSVVIGPPIISSVCYKISAFDTESLESEKTSEECVPVSELNKDIAANKLDENILALKLFNAYPNPFNPITRITYQVDKIGYVQIKIIDILGNEIKELINEIKSPGTYIVYFNAENLSTGLYFYSMKASNYYDVKKLMIIK